MILEYKYLKKLKKRLKKKNGRNFRGIITVRHRGGGHKRKYNIIDYKYYLLNIPFIILDILKNSNSNINVGLVYYSNNLLSYISLASGNRKGDILIISNTLNILRNGNICSLRLLNIGNNFFNIELYLGHGSQLNRTGGSFGLLLRKYVTKKNLRILIKLKSSEEYLIYCNNFIQIGKNLLRRKKNLLKAGVNRWKNKRPKVRGVAMNPVDHPHGGGEGKTSGGRLSVTPYGKLTKGKKTRKKNKNKYFIYRRRKKKKKKKK